MYINQTLITALIKEDVATKHEIHPSSGNSTELNMVLPLK